MICPKHLKDHVIVPTLQMIDCYSDAAVNLLLGTAAAESNLGYYLKQLNGPAIGIYQMEPATHRDIWINYLKYRVGFIRLIKEATGVMREGGAGTDYYLIINLAYATAMARLQYYRVDEPLPPADDILALAKYWKKYYNTEEGKGTVSHFMQSFQMIRDNL